jgi:hypothetical protein
MLRFGSELSTAAQRDGLLRIPLIASIILAPVLLGYLFGFDRSALSIVIALCLMPLIAVLDTRRNYFVATSRVLSVFQLDSVRSLASLALLVLFVTIGGLTSWMPLAAMLLAAIISLVVVSSKVDNKSKQGEKAIDGGYLRYGFWVACWMGVIGLLPLFERLLLERQYGISVAGLYGTIADPLSSIASASGAVIVSALMPKYVAAWASRDDAHLRMLTHFAVIGVIAGSVLALVGGFVIALADWGQWGNVLRANTQLALTLVLASTIWQLGIFFHKPLELQSATNRMFFCLLVAGLLFVALASAMVSAMGAEGIALAKVLAGIAYIGLVTWADRKSFA